MTPAIIKEKLNQDNYAGWWFAGSSLTAAKLFVLLTFSRIIAWGGMGYRTWVHRSELKAQVFGIPALVLFVVVWVSYLALLPLSIKIFKFFVDKRKPISDKSVAESFRKSIWAMIIIDSICYSLFYILTLKPESDLFLLFFIPMVNGIMLLNEAASRRIWMLAVFCLFTSLVVMFLIQPYTEIRLLGPPSLNKFFIHIFPIRALAFFFASVPFSLLADRTRQLQDTYDALADAERLYHSLVETLPQCILLKDRNGKFKFANKSFLNFLGQSEKDVLEKVDGDFFPAELAKAYKKDDEQILSGEKLEINKVERNRVLNRNENLSVRVVKVPYKNSKGEIIGIQAIFWDETDAQREKHKLLQWFLHDTPKPLTAIRDKWVYQLEKLASKLERSDRIEAENTCRKISNVIDFTTASFHAYGYLGDPHKFAWNSGAEFHIEEVLDIVLQVIKPNHQEIRFVKLMAGNFTVVSDRYKIIAIIYLLVENAVKAVGKISTDRPEISIEAEIVEQYLTLKVKDNGIGIQEAVRPHVFDEGFSTFGSSGLGLAIVRGFSELAGGCVTVDSTEGKGATFFVKLKLGNWDNK